MAVSIAIVCEAPADQRTGGGLADRVFCAEVAWLEDGMLDHARTWRGLNPGDPCLLWTTVKRQARTTMIPMESFGGERAAPDAHAARKALWLLHASESPPHAVVFLRDDDCDPNRRKGLDQARRFSRFAIPIVIGVAHPKRECWVLAGFDAQDDQEHRRLEELRRELGFDPREKTEQLTARQESAKRSAKRALNVLTGGDAARQAECWEKADLTLLAARGKNTGLAEYLNEVRTHLVPLFGVLPPAR